MSAGVAVAVIPHPDDESYAFAGTLAWLGAHRWSLRVLCMTRGEAGQDLRPSPDGPLGAARAAELAASCAHLGATAELLDLPDGGIARHDVDLSPHLADADLVLTLGDDGAYGHPDHLATTRLVERARFDATLLHAAFPRGLFAPIHRIIGRHVALEIGVDALGTDREAVDVVVDVRPYRDVKLACVAAHRSQVPDGDPRRFLRRGFIDALLDEEWLVHVRGPAFEGP